MSALVIILVLVLLFTVLNLRQRVIDLEKKIKGGVPQTPAPAVPAGLPGIAPQPFAAPAQAAIAVPPAENRFVSWLQENWLLKLGALLLLIGFGWLVTYAFLNNWIGPSGRITLGLVGGALILALGYWRMRSFVTQGSVFVALGATVILLTTFAARNLYDFFTPESALALMWATSALVAFASGLFNRKQLAIASVMLAGVAPMLAGSPSAEYVPLFAYLLIVVLGAVWIVVWKDFREVVLTALVVVALYSAPLLIGFESADMPALLLFAYAFAAVFYLANTAGLMRLKGSAATSDMVTAAGNALLLLAWVRVAAPENWQSLIMAAWAAAFMLGAFVVFRASGRREQLFLYAAIGIGYIAAATALELDGAALTIAYTLESAAVALALYGITRDAAVAQRSTLLLAGPAVLSFGSMLSSDWRDTVLNPHFFVLLIIGAAFFALGGLFYRDVHAGSSEDAKKANAALLVIGSLYAYVLLWLSLHAALPSAPDTAVMVSLFVYTVIGVTAYLQGAFGGRKGLRAYGGVLLGFVVARLLIVDVWQMAISGRIITFFLIGTLLMSTAFLGRRKETPQSGTQV